MRFRSGALLAGGALLGALVFGSQSAAERPKRERLLIAATTQSLGNLEPCNCVEGMLGGYPRRVAALHKLRAAGPVLVLDGGDLTGKQHHPALLTAKTRAALDLLRASGVAAVAVGERDLRLGVAQLSRLAQDAKVNLLAANVWTGEGDERRRPFESHAVIDIGGRSVVVIGVLDPELGDPSGQVQVSDPGAAIRALKTPAGTKVILFHGSADAAREQLGKLVGISAVICGHDQQQVQPLARLGEAVFVEALRDARSIATLELGDEPRVGSVPLDGFVPDDPRARARVEHYYKEVEGLPGPDRKPTEGGEFVGAQECRTCHGGAYEAFVESQHHGVQAKVIAKDPKRAKLPECIQCHVTGYGFESGFSNMEDTPHLAEVGCEACHGVGGNHVARDGGRGYGVLPNFPQSWKARCVECHDPSNSPKFDFEPWLERIKHWKDRGPRK